VNITSGQILAEVIDDPNQLFLIQADEDIVQADIGQNAAVAYTAGSNITGISAMELDSSTILTTNTLVLKIVGLYNAPSNELGENFAQVVVKINAHQYGSIGVAGLT
jgi:hypothetical protein